MPDADGASLREWLARPEWALLIEVLRGHEAAALDALVGADPRDPAAVARAQTELRVLRHFTSGDAARELRVSLKPAPKP